MASADLPLLARRLLTAFASADLDSMRAILAEDMVSYVTNRDGGVDRLVGREEYLSRILAMDLPQAQYSVSLTQPPVVVDDGRVLIMVEVRAAESGRALHNFAAHPLRVTDGRVAEWWMVDAKPAESDEFWS
jgi:ketosteroid isomerase-like protein